MVAITINVWMVTSTIWSTGARLTQGVKEKFPDLPDSPSEEDVFLSLRLLRNDW